MKDPSRNKPILNEPTARKAETIESGPHWYGLTPPRTTADDASRSDRSGRARQRRERRQTTDGHKVGPLQVPRPTISPTYVVLGLAILAIGAFFLFILNLVGKGSAGNGVEPTRAVQAAVGLPTATPNLTLDIKPWSGKGRFTILLMGLDTRPEESMRDARTDTMIVLSLDPETKTAGMLSIPRDLYVPIPGESDMQRINAAYVVGELRKPGSGPTVAMQTLQYNLGIKINGYVAVTFPTVIAIVDAVGGVDINVPSAIDDEEYPDMNYGFDPLHIAAGQQHMDGALALKYARTRHQTSDFDRVKRQQQVILALRERVTKLNLLPQLVQQAPALWSQLNTGFATDLTLDQILSLAVYARDIPLNKIQNGSIEGDYLRAVPNSTEQAVTIRRERIGELMVRLFGPNYAK